MAHIVSITNQKGGVGKTTTAINVAAGLSAMRKRVLLIDLDPQGNATSGSGIDHTAKTCLHLFIENTPVEQVIQKSSYGYHVIPGNYSLTRCDIGIMNHPRKAFFLKQALAPIINNYDYILLDCPPALNNLTLNAQGCAHYLIVPVQCEFFALEGLTKLLGTIEQIKKQVNPDLKVLGLIRTMFDGRSRLTQYVSKELEKHFSDRVFNSVIPRNIKLAEAPSHGKPIMYHDPKSQGALAYLALSAEIDRKANARQYANLLKEPV
ncbi:MAG: ParA family protein [Gammaproteobacteria bacterium]|nr:ParA family protein [Gammaproteobacteria bacterium]